MREEKKALLNTKEALLREIDEEAKEKEDIRKMKAATRRVREVVSRDGETAGPADGAESHLDINAVGSRSHSGNGSREQVPPDRASRSRRTGQA